MADSTTHASMTIDSCLRAKIGKVANFIVGDKAGQGIAYSRVLQIAQHLFRRAIQLENKTVAVYHNNALDQIVQSVLQATTVLFQFFLISVYGIQIVVGRKCQLSQLILSMTLRHL